MRRLKVALSICLALIVFALWHRWSRPAAPRLVKEEEPAVEGAADDPATTAVPRPLYGSTAPWTGREARPEVTGDLIEARRILADPASTMSQLLGAETDEICACHTDLCVEQASGLYGSKIARRPMPTGEGQIVHAHIVRMRACLNKLGGKWAPPPRAPWETYLRARRINSQQDGGSPPSPGEQELPSPDGQELPSPDGET